MQVIDRSLTSDPLNPEATFNLAMSEWTKGSITDLDAVERMRRSAANRPKSWEPQYYLGLMHVARKDLEAARDAFTAALRLSPDEAQPREALVAMEGRSQGWPKRLRTISAHPRGIYTASLSLDGRLLATGGGDEKTCVWVVSTGELLRVFEGSSSGNAAFLPDGKSILIPALGDLNCWRLDDGALTRKYSPKFSLGLRVGGWIAYTALLPDGRGALTITSDGEVRLLDLESGKSRTVMEVRQRGFCGCAASSPDGKCAVIGSGMTQGAALLVDLSDGRMSALPVHTGGLSSVDVTADYILTGSYDGAACLWDRRRGAIYRTFKRWQSHTDSTLFIQAGKYALSESHGYGARILDLSSGKEVRSFDRGDHYDPYAFLPDARQRLSLENEMSMNMPVQKRGEDSVTSVALSSDGRFAATGTYGGKAFLWDIGTGQCLRTFAGFPREVRCLSFTPDSKRFLIAALGTEYEHKSIIEIWDVDAFEPLQFAPIKCEPIESKQTRPWENPTATDAESQALAQKVEDAVRRRNWDEARTLLRQGQALPGYERHPSVLKHLLRSGYFSIHPGLPFVRTMTGHTGRINSTSVSPDGRRAVSAGQDGTIRVWDLSAMSQVMTITAQGGPVKKASFSADGKRVIALERDSAARIYEAGSGRCVEKLGSSDNPLTDVTLSRKGQLAAAAANREAFVWDLRRGESMSLSHHEQVVSVAFVGDQLLTATRDGGMFRWRLERGQTDRRLFFGRVASAVVFPGDYLDRGLPLALTCAADGTARMWNLDANACAGIARDHSGRAVSVSAITQGDSTPAKFVVTACDDGFAYVWSLASGRCERKVPNPLGSAEVVSYSPKLKIALTAGLDNELQVWSLEVKGSGRNNI